MNLLTLDDIADKWKVSRVHARDVLIKMQDFPEPAPGSTRKQMRWRQADIDMFINQLDYEVQE